MLWVGLKLKCWGNGDSEIYGRATGDPLSLVLVKALIQRLYKKETLTDLKKKLCMQVSTL